MPREGGIDPGVTLDVLAGEWRIYQLRAGHRFSADDLLTAWTAARSAPRATRLLDLGAGIGSVGLLVLWRLGSRARLTAVEIQAVSHRLARRTVEHNGLADRVTLLHQDLRGSDAGEFDLVTGSPPYISPSNGTPSAHPQKAAARFELHGNLFDYCRAASRALADDGVFCFCHSARDARPEAAIREAGLVLVQRREVHFRAGDPPMIALFTCARQGQREDAPPISLRDAHGRWTADYLTMRREMGAPEGFLTAAERGIGDEQAVRAAALPGAQSPD
jgi:tRNA1(Val) A37 N6-methylase TrmN6